jgi:uncharacterized membrane protein YraQ (UPF0718 family)
MVFTYIFYGAAVLLLILSFVKDRQKTTKALLKAWKAFENILPQFIAILFLAGIMLAFLTPETISRFIGRKSGWWGVVGAALVGSVTLIPGFLAFPMAALLLKNGAGAMQIGAFVSTLMMVGVITLPVEIKYLGKKVALLRNLMAFAFSFLVALVIGWVVP